jgi:hypothetical protein
MRIVIAVIVVWASASFSWAAGPQAPRAREANSRLTFHRGHWWYWLPSKQWAIHVDGHWVTPPAQRSPQGEHSNDAPTTASQRAEPASFANSYPDAAATAGNAETPAAGNRSEDAPTIAELDFEVRQLRKSLERLERQVRVQRQTQSALVRRENAAASALQQQSDEADEHAKQVEKNRVGID